VTATWPATSSRIALALARFRDAYGRLLEWVVSALMILLAVEVTAGVVFRAAGHSLIWYDELASVLLAWLTFYGAALASVKRAHIGCPEVVEKMPWAARRVASIVAQVLVIAFFLLLGAVGVWVLPVLATDHMVSLPAVPISAVQSVIPIAALLIVIAECTHLVDLVIARTPPPKTGELSLAEGLH
jgi:TRAP-type C4-dicarboxylate transport system permease small subunit